MTREIRKASVKAVLVTAITVLASTTANAETLKEAMGLAISNHPDVKIAVENQSAIKQEWRQAKAGYLPSVDVTLGSGHERSNNSTTRNDASEGAHRSLWRNESRLTVSQMLFDGFQTSSNVCQQRYRYLSADHNVNEIMQNTGLRTVQAYLDVLRYNELIALAQKNLETHSKLLQQIKSRTEGGRGSQADVRQAEGRMALAKANLLAAQGDLRKAQATYLQVVGKRAEGLARDKAPIMSLPKTLEDALNRAMENNPAIKSAQHDIQASQAALRGTKSAFYPRLDLDVEAARQHNLDGVKQMNNEYLAMARVSYNLYRGGADLARKREQAARVNEASETLEKDRRFIEEGVYQAWANYETAKARLAPLSQHVTSSDQTRKAYKSQFDIGQRSLLDLLDSEIEVFNAKSALINGQYAVDFSVYEVLTNTGDLTDTVLMAEK